MNGLKARVDRNRWSDEVEVWFYEINEAVQMSVSTQLVMEKVTPGTVAGTAPIRLTNVAAQGLMDQLWEAGLRPSQGSGSAGSLAATERHLADMRALVFKTAPKA